MPVHIESSNVGWVEQFERERRLLDAVLAPWLVSPLEHVGSTSVPGLDAKPIIDMMAGVDDLTEARAAIAPLSRVRYVHAEHRPDALYFYRARTDADGAETHHLHLTEVDSPLWRERLTFRDALRADPQLAGRYHDLKIELAARFDDLRPYTDGKRAFVAEVLSAAGISLTPRH